MRAPRLSGPCDPRRIATVARWDLAGWRLKVHGIVYGDGALDPALLAAARTVAASALAPPGTYGDYGVGYVGVHQGRGINVVFVDFWANENELFHRVFLSRPGDPVSFDRAPEDGLSACVWDVRVMAHERDAWLAHVLRNPKGPDVDAYLAAGLDTRE